MTTKERVQKILAKMPDDCSLEDVQEQLAVFAMLDQRLAEADDPNTRLIPHEEVRQRMMKWIQAR